MNKFVFLRAGLPIIGIIIGLSLIYSYFDEKGTWWFLIKHLLCICRYFSCRQNNSKIRIF